MPDLLEIEEIAPAIAKRGVPGVPGVQPNACAMPAGTPAGVPGVPGVPPQAERPCYRVLDDWLEDGEKLRPGVWHFGIKPGKGEAPATLTNQWICSPLHLEAVTSDPCDNNYGRMLRFKNTAGRWRTWAMPMELLRGTGDELRGALLAMGVMIDPAGHREFARYLQARVPERRVTCATQTGWLGKVFVLPDACYGPGAAAVTYQSGEHTDGEFSTGGDLKGWRDHIAAMAVGNPVLMLALSAAFAGPVMHLVRAESGGVHLVGNSSTGKTTGVEAARSVWGGDRFKRSWNSTANGLEGAASQSNDCLLVLDEINQADPRDVGAIIYALGNGVGKQRASRTGSARAVTRWRTFVLSSGERSVATAMAEGGIKAKAGHGVRLLDVPVARKFGAWDDLHGFSDGPAFSDALAKCAATHYGHAGREFLERLTRDKSDMAALWERVKSLDAFAACGDGQVKRAAARFALAGMAGELATEYGLTAWEPGAAVKSAIVAFNAWRDHRGATNAEQHQIVEAVSGFITRHGDARFSDVDATRDTMVRDRAGWWRNGTNGREYLFTPDGLREALKGFDFKAGTHALTQAGMLAKPGADGKTASLMHIDGRRMRVYVVQPGGNDGA